MRNCKIFSVSIDHTLNNINVLNLRVTEKEIAPIVCYILKNRSLYKIFTTDEGCYP